MNKYVSLKTSATMTQLLHIVLTHCFAEEEAEEEEPYETPIGMKGNRLQFISFREEVASPSSHPLTLLLTGCKRCKP